MTSVRSIGHQFAWVSGGRIGAALLQAVTLVLFARTSQPAVFGIVSALLGAFLVVVALADLGVTSRMTATKASGASQGEVAAALRFNVMSSLLIAVLLSCAAWLVGAGAGLSPWLLVLLAISAGLDRYADVRATLSLADGDPRLFVSNLNLRRTVTLVGLLIVLWVTADGLAAFSLGTVAGSAIAAAVAFISTRSMSREGAEPLGALLRASWPYWLNSVGAQVKNLDVTIVAAVGGASVSGWYAAASRLTSPFRIIPTALATVLLPNVARLRAEGSTLKPAVSATTKILAVSSVLYLAAAVAAPWVVVPILGGEYSGSVLPIQIVLLGMPFAAVVSLGTSTLQALGYEKRVGLIAMVSSGACLGLVCVGAILGGAPLAAVGLTISYLLQACLISALLPGARRRLRKERLDAA